MQNHFQITVSRKRRPEDEYGVHFFTTEVRDEPDARVVAATLRERFHPNEWKVSVTEWRASGRNVHM